MRDVPRTMKTISKRIFKSLPAAAETVFSADTYLDCLHSPKSAERDRRGCGECFMVNGLNMHRPTDWNGFLTNDENKKVLIHLLLDHWSSRDMMEEILRRPVIFIEAGQAFKIGCNAGVISQELLPEICSKHEETDVRVIITYSTSKTKGLTSQQSESEQKTLTFSSSSCIMQSHQLSTSALTWEID